jgi:hypothetical protein
MRRPVSGDRDSLDNLAGRDREIAPATDVPLGFSQERHPTRDPLLKLFKAPK